MITLCGVEEIKLDIKKFYKQIILDHAKNKRNYKELDHYTHKIHYKNPTCGDILTMYALLEEEKVKDISFIGEGCFISMASTSMFTDVVKNKSIEDIQRLSLQMEQMIVDGVEVDGDDLEDALSLKDIHQLPARYNCALMPWQAFNKLIK